MNVSGKITDSDNEREPFLKERKQLCCNMLLPGCFINIIIFILFLQLGPFQNPVKAQNCLQGPGHVVTCSVCVLVSFMLR